MKGIIRVTHSSDSPKYQQVINNVIESIQNGKLKRGAQLPSIAEVATSQKTAKVTIAKAYEILRESGIIISRHGKGFYVASDEVKMKLNIFVFFDTINAYKEILYKAFKDALPPTANCSIFFHHYDINLFESLIKNNIGKYNFYVVMPHFDKDVASILKLIPREKLLLLDKNVSKLDGNYAAVYQDFENDIYKSLSQGLKLIKKYHALHIVLGKEHFQYVPLSIIKGFEKFCKQHKVHYTIIDNLSEHTICKNDSYLIFSDTDLILFIKHCNKMKWQFGKDIGLISYDDTPMKEILLNGVTVISTDFEKMGEAAGELINQNKKEKIANDASMIIRKSL